MLNSVGTAFAAIRFLSARYIRELRWYHGEIRAYVVHKDVFYWRSLCIM